MIPVHPRLQARHRRQLNAMTLARNSSSLKMCAQKLNVHCTE